MGWYAEKLDKFWGLPKPLIYAHISAKIVFGIGLGILLATYFQGHDWLLYGWLLIVLSLIVAIPSTYSLFKK